jgi:autotransporter-associated beta strand protein
VTLGGSSTGANTISGQMIDGVSALTIQKSGSGTWILAHPENTYTGATNINAGKLVLTGSLASSITTNTATFAPQGAPATSGSLTQAATSIYQVRLTSTGADRLSVSGAVTLDGTLELLPEPGLASNASFTVLDNTGTAAIAGNFAGLPEGAAFSAGGYDWHITYLGGDGNDVVLTNLTVPPALSAIEQWRLTHFGASDNTGNAADSFDPNADGEANLLEFATGQNPHAATRATTTVEPGGTVFTYTRSKAAFDGGFGFDVQHSDTLAPDSWISIGPGTVIETNGDLQTVTATIPAADRRFVRLSVSTP